MAVEDFLMIHAGHLNIFVTAVDQLHQQLVVTFQHVCMCFLTGRFFLQGYFPFMKLTGHRIKCF